MQALATKPIKAATLGLALLALLSYCSIITADPPTAVDDSAATLPNTPIVIPVLMNDAVSANNSTAILRISQPSHGTVIRNSTPASHAELMPLFRFAATQLSNTVVQVAITNLYPWYLISGVWRTVPTNTAVNFDQNWVGGFFPGSLWLIYEQTGDPNFKQWAQMWQAALAPEQYSTAKDDVGFLINCSFGNGYRITGNPQYKDILTQTRRSFTNRWNAVVGCLADDRLLTPPPFEVIVDTMMNTEIFYRADLDPDPDMLAMAISHAGRTLTNHLRADGSTFMRVIYDGVTNGSVLLKDNRVPIGPLDTWARGQAWATHAFPLLYGATGDGRFLGTAKSVADFYISHAPADYVPYWYYPATGVDTTLLRDSSAAAVTLSGLVDLSQQVTNDSDGAKYWLAAHRLFVSLSSTSYLAANTSNAILLHANPVDANTDTSVIYADYYFIESLKRLNDLFNQTTLTYVPASNFTGTDSFTYQACDSSGAVSTATVTVTVGSGAQVYTVAVSPLPLAGGSVSGGGTFAAGSSVTVTAMANTGYQFANWTEGTAVVSGSPSYTFPVNGNRTLVANFTQPSPGVTTSKSSYATGEPIVANFTHASGNAHDWIGLFASGAPNTAYLQWIYTDRTTTGTAGIIDGSVTFASGLLTAGNYEARLFFKDSYVLAATASFTVQNSSPPAPTVTTSKSSYATGEAVVANFTNASGNAHDWIGLFAVGAPNTAYLQWIYTDRTTTGTAGIINGSVTFANGLSTPGNYEARLFFNNSYQLQATAAFTVPTGSAPAVAPGKATYGLQETIVANFANTSGNARDWIGLFQAGAANTAFLKWTYVDGTQAGTQGKANGSVNFTGGIATAGSYEMRLFFKDSYTLQASAPFAVSASGLQSVARHPGQEPTGSDLVLSVMLSPNGLSLECSGPAGQRCTIEVSSDLIVWTPLTSMQLPNHGTAVAPVRAEPPGPRFYRASALPTASQAGPTYPTR